MANEKEKNNYQQASFRLTPDTHDIIRDIATAKNVSQAEVMRGLTNLLKRHVLSCTASIKLAIVDTDDSIESSHYRVVEWLVFD